MEPMLKGSQELPKSKLIKSGKVNSVEMVFCRCVICFCFLLFFVVLLCLFVFSLSPKSRCQIFCDTSSVRKNVKAILAMAAIHLPLYNFPCSLYKREDIVVLCNRQLFQL